MSNLHSSPNPSNSEPLPKLLGMFDLLDPAKLDFSNALKVVNRTQRFVLSVPALPEGGELLVFPEGTPNAGQSLKKDRPVPERGVVFFNGKDEQWQGVIGDGTRVIIINEVDADQAKLIQQKVEALCKPSVEGIKAILAYARSEFGLVDFYNSNRESVSKNLSLIGPGNPCHMQVTKDTVHSAIYAGGAFSFPGPVVQNYPQGGVILNDGRHIWGIDSGVFIRNFRAVEDGVERPLRALELEFPSK